MTLEDRLERLASRTPPGDPTDVLAAARSRVDSRPAARRAPFLAAAAAGLAIIALAAGALTLAGDDGAEVATSGRPNAQGTATVLSGEAGGEAWTVVEYVEDDPVFVDEPTTCLRFEPPTEDGPFFCGTADDIVGAHGRLMRRPSGEQTGFNGLSVFAGVVAPQVAEVVLSVNGQETVVEPAPWPGRDLGIAVIMLRVPPGAIPYYTELRDSDGQVLAVGGVGS